VLDQLAALLDASPHLGAAGLASWGGTRTVLMPKIEVQCPGCGESVEVNVPEGDNPVSQRQPDGRYIIRATIESPQAHLCAEPSN
jgi:hypothetical protein